VQELPYCQSQVEAKTFPRGRPTRGHPARTARGVFARAYGGGGIITFCHLMELAQKLQKQRRQRLVHRLSKCRNEPIAILQDIRYAGPDNFTGQKVPDYDANECVLKRPVAEALAKIQAELRWQSLGLKVYDCYRPARAKQAFFPWSGHRDVLRRGPSKGLCVRDVSVHFSPANRHSL